ncbi:MAG: hypothetical protein EOO05_19535 [Chitinophagaceae bacterium]|nr:MAG: hypothetical protein EOO05_19535 [Chitinophagaceae bacterium]
MKPRFPSKKLNPWPLAILAGLTCTGYAYYLYVNTNIPDSLVLTVYLAGASLFFLLMKWWKRSTRSVIIRILLSLACGGGVLMAILLWTNKTFASKESLVADFPVVARGTTPGGSGIHTPYLVIDFNGNRKQLSFYPEAAALADKAQVVKVNYRQGLLGFEIIRSRALYK